LLTLSFAPLAWWPLAFAMPRRSCGCGRARHRGARPSSVSGSTRARFALGTYWIYISTHIVYDAPIVVALLLMAGLVSIMSSITRC
jgi:apolipoprotein N-acyltransferase